MSLEMHKRLGVGPLSAALTQVVKELAEQPQALTDKIITAMHDGIADYRQTTSHDLPQDAYDSVSRNVDIWYQALLTGQPPGAQALGELADFGRHRVHQGVSLAGLLQAYRIGSRVIWQHLLEASAGAPELEHELLVTVSPYILYHFDLLGQTIGQSYGAEAQKIARWRDRVRHDLCGLIFGGSQDLQRFHDMLMQLGLDDSTPHTALAFELPSLKQDQQLHPLGDDIVVSLSEQTGLHRDRFLHYRHHDHLFAWLPMVAGEQPAATEMRLLQWAQQVARQHKVRSGLGLPNSGPGGWRQTAEQARRAITLGRQLHPRKYSYRYLDVCLDDAAFRDTGISSFLQSVVERLASEGDLLDTLQHFFDCRGQRKKIATELGIHPNTLAYRLDRIENLLQVKLDDPNRHALLHTALRLRRFSRQKSS